MSGGDSFTGHGKDGIRLVQGEDALKVSNVEPLDEQRARCSGSAGTAWSSANQGSHAASLAVGSPCGR